MSITKEEVAQTVRDWADAFTSGNFERLWGMERESAGFGYRSSGARAMAAIGHDQYLRLNGGLLEGVDYFRMTFETLETEVIGNLGIAWGWFIEEFQHKGQPPERARVRFSQVMRKDDSGWKVVMFHRDIQPFGEDGRYPRELTST